MMGSWDEAARATPSHPPPQAKCGGPTAISDHLFLEERIGDFVDFLPRLFLRITHFHEELAILINPAIKY